MVLIHIACRDAKKKIKSSGHLKTFHHFREFSYFLLKFKQGIRSMVIQQYMAKGNKAFVDFFLSNIAAIR